MKKALLFSFLFFLCAGAVQAQIITTVAGNGVNGYCCDNGPATAAELSSPYATAVDLSGNLFIADADNNCIRKINTSGIITTIAGTGVAGYSGDDSAATNAKLNSPCGIAIDKNGIIYISDNYNNRIRKINAAGIITTIAGTDSFGYNGDNGPATAAMLYSPHHIAIDTNFNLYICDVLNNRVRKVSATGIITTIAGTGDYNAYSGDGGQATATDIGQPYGVAIDANGNIIFADLSYNRVCKINTSGIISTVAGTGISSYNGDNILATAANINEPFSVTIDKYNNIFIADYFNWRVRKVDAEGVITTYAGTGLPGYNGDNIAATTADLDGPIDVTIDNVGNLYITVYASDRIRYIKSPLSVISVIDDKMNIWATPNPNNGSFQLKVESGMTEPIAISIATVTGAVIKQLTTTTNKIENIALNVSPGVYFLLVRAEGKSISQKIVITK